MSAEIKEADVRIHFVMSDTDTKDGLRIVPEYRNKKFTLGYDDDVDTTGSFKLNHDQLLGTAITDDDIIDWSKAKVAKNDDFASVEYSVRNGNTEITKGDLTAILSSAPFAGSVRDVTIYVTVTYDKVGVDGDNTPDKVDDRTQKAYSVHLETAIDSGLYKVAETYRVNNNDDLVKLVTNGDYVNLPGWDTPAYDAEGNEYYYQYTIDGDDIYGDYVKASHSSFASKATPENTLDKDGDGVVTCDEYYGVTG